MVSFKLGKTDGDSFAIVKGKSGDPSSGISELIKNYLRDLNKASKAKQLTVGAITGWTAGYVASKFGKIAATAIGGSLLLIQIAKYNGYIEIDWNKFNRDVKAAKASIDRSKSKFPVIIDNVQQFASENVVLAGGFASGFLLGFASA